MLFFSLPCCLAMYWLARIAAKNGEGWRKLLMLSGLVLPFSCGTLVFPPLFALYTLLMVSFGWAGKNLTRQSLLPQLCNYSLIFAFAFPGGFAFVDWLKIERLVWQNSFVSMANRVPEPGPLNRLENLSDAMEKELALAEGAIHPLVSHPDDPRVKTLRQLHEERTHDFINHPGFGVGRTHSNARTADDIRPSLYFDTPPAVPQPTLRDDSSQGADPTSRQPETPLFAMHRSALLDFVNPGGFGLVNRKSRSAAGFVSHRFRSLPASPKPWKIERLELVGLLLKPEPVVYLSPNLPSMDELRRVPTRPLDPFEATALQTLREGEELVVEGTDSRWRMLGSLRNAKQCTACHGGQRGDLLGAFSYVLRRGD